MIGIGVIGSGYWGRKHVDEYSKISQFNLLAVSDKVNDNLKFCIENYNVPRTTTDHQELLNSSDIDAVSICTDNESHYSVCTDALTAGKHVLIEKPITLDSSQAQELVNLADEVDRVLAVGHIFRFNNALAHARNLIKENFFGDIFQVKLRWTTLMPSPERDVLFDLAPHAFDIMNFLLDDWPVRVSCFGGAYRRQELEETAIVVSEFESGILGSMELSWLSPPKTRDVLIVGRDRQLWLDALSQEGKVFESGYEYDPGVERNNTLRDELVHFANLIDGKCDALNSGEIGVKTVKCIESAHRALREKRSVELDL